MPTLTPLQQAFVDTFEGEARAAMQHTLENDELLYAVVITCMNGQFSTGSQGDENTPIPCLMTREEAEAELADEQREYATQIAEGDRDEDDEFEGEVMAVRWHEDDTLSFFTPGYTAPEQALTRQSVAYGCGY